MGLLVSGFRKRSLMHDGSDKFLRLFRRQQGKNDHSSRRYSDYRRD
jgi:hypothetical protein